MMVTGFKYSDTNKRFHTLDYEYKKIFGKKTVKIPLNAGLGCPNRDGKKGFGGCIYCSGALSGEFAGDPKDSFFEQFEQTKKLYLSKWPDFIPIAYLQAGTNTYADPKRLEEIYDACLSLGVAGLSISTRPDCISDEIADLLLKYSKKTFLTVELGLQTSNDETAKDINRCHSFSEFTEGFNKLKKRNIRTGIHIINGLPGESYEDMMNTARDVARLCPDELKIHLLHVVKGTELERRYQKGEIRCLEKEEYIKIVCDQLEILPPEIAIGRVTGDGDRKTLIAPLWSLDKRSVLNGIDIELSKRGTYQGAKFTI